jgi:hypothetical protein
MIDISKDDMDKIVLSILTEVSKHQNKEFAEESLKLLNDDFDNDSFSAILINKAVPSVFDKHEQIFQNSLLTIIGSFFYNADNNKIDLIKSGFSDILLNSIKKGDCLKKSGNFNPSLKFRFATSRFVDAFLEYERLEEDYPNIMKTL